MALVAVSQAIADAWKAIRIGAGNTTSVAVYDCLVSDLAVGDFLIGSRIKVTSIGTPASGLTPITGTRANGTTGTFSFVTTSSLRIMR